ncbi:MAG: squalene/phytoene synthase family protein, partial [Verrucomicrobiota bacterium]
MTTTLSDPHAITRASKSNLALAFIALPKNRRHDITVFYAWCRIIDDIADDPGHPVAHRRLALQTWKNALLSPTPNESPLAVPIRHLIAKYQLPIPHFLEIIAGVEMDLDQVSYETWEDLRLYCYRVASAVGLISIEIFSYHHPACQIYAVELGLALQLTNIIRDVGQDFANGQRIYLPLEDLHRFSYSPDHLAQGLRSPAFLNLMHWEANRALSFYQSASSNLPPIDRKNMVAAEIMRSVYLRLLHKIIRSDFNVFSKRHSLNRLEKIAIILITSLRSQFTPTPLL